MNVESEREPGVAVIGAGISGLACAAKLAREGVRYRLFEKSGHPGGRSIGTSWRGNRIDHGAQYFTVQSRGFRETLDRVLLPGSLCEIDAAVIDLQTNEPVPGHKGPRYYLRGGFSDLSTAMAKEHEIEFNNPVLQLRLVDGGWLVNGEFFDLVVATLPWSHLCTLLPGLPTSHVRYAPCLAWILAYDTDPEWWRNQPYARMDYRQIEDLAWSACENHKLGHVTTSETIMIAQMSTGYSAANPNENDQVSRDYVLSRIEDLWGLSASACVEHRRFLWDPARVTGREGTLPHMDRLVFAGDVVGESRIEDVFHEGEKSGFRCVDMLKS